MVKRQVVWIDSHVQGALVGRVVLYWFGIVIYFGLSMGILQWMENPELSATQNAIALFDQLWPCFVTLVLLLPLVIFDMVRLSHRFVGPIYRLRNHLRLVAENPKCHPLNFRDDDYWQQLADPINELQNRIASLEDKAGVKKPASPAPVVLPSLGGLSSTDELISQQLSSRA